MDMVRKDYSTAKLEIKHTILIISTFPGLRLVDLNFEGAYLEICPILRDICSTPAINLRKANNRTE